MAPDPDARWKQRLRNYSSALEQLKRAVELSRARELSELEKQGLIQAFEFTHELAWNVMKDYFRYQGGQELVTGSRDTTRAGFSAGILEDGETWMEMIRSRNQTSHTYNKSVAEEIVTRITHAYFDAFEKFQKVMKDIAAK